MKLFPFLLFVTLSSTLIQTENPEPETLLITSEQFLQLVDEYQATGIVPGTEKEEATDNHDDGNKLLFFTTIAKVLTGFSIAVASQDPAKIIGGACSMFAAGIEFAVRTHRPKLAKKYDEKTRRIPLFETAEEALLDRLRYYLDCIYLIQKEESDHVAMESAESETVKEMDLIVR